MITLYSVLLLTLIDKYQRSSGGGAPHLSVKHWLSQVSLRQVEASTRQVKTRLAVEPLSKACSRLVEAALTILPETIAPFLRGGPGGVALTGLVQAGFFVGKPNVASPQAEVQEAEGLEARKDN